MRVSSILGRCYTTVFDNDVFHYPFKAAEEKSKVDDLWADFKKDTAAKPKPKPKADIFSLKHESSIFRSVIQPCMWLLHDGTG